MALWAQVAGASMSYWKPDFTDRDEVLQAHGRGSGVAVLLAFLLLLQAATTYLAGSIFASTDLIEFGIRDVAGTLAAAVLALVVAWQFSVGKGAFSGAVLLAMMTLGVVFLAIGGEFAGAIVGAVIAIGLFHAVRAAFIVRSWPDEGAA